MIKLDLALSARIEKDVSCWLVLEGLGFTGE